MDAIADIIDSVDTPMGLLALVIIGFFSLAWKFGKEIITALREIRSEQAAVRAEVDVTKAVAEHVSSSIVTNHGSKNIGDAIDRLTGWFQDSEVERAENTQLLQLVAARLDQHIADCTPKKGQSRASAQH